jgi:hypothetical protein
MSNQSVTAVPHKHAEVIKAWADGAAIECLSHVSWVACPGPSWQDYGEYRVKPEPPTMVYPVTQMKYAALTKAYNDGVPDGLTSIANAALRHAIDAGQIITAADHQDALTTLGNNLRDIEIARHAGRDMAIAEVVRETCREIASAQGACHSEDAISRTDLAAIIAGIRP